MGPVTNNQNGFSVVEAVLILVILGIVGFTGYYVWHVKQSADKNLSASTSTAPINNKAQTTSTFVKKFPELGIQMTLPVTLENLVYTLDKGTFDGGSGYIVADVTTKELNAWGSRCGSDAIGGLFKIDGTAPQKQETDTSPPTATKQFASFYINFSKGNGTVCDSPKFPSLYKDFVKSLGTIEEIK